MPENTVKPTHFGVHLTLDGYGGDEKTLADKDFIESLLNEMPKKFGLHTLIDPVTVEVGPNNKKDPGGVTGFVIIAESHISFHTFPALGFISADVYTCNDDMDTESIIEFFKNSFKLDEVESNFIIRGKKYPSHLL